MHKLIMRGIIILIGLNGLSSCISDVFTWDKPVDAYSVIINNESQQEILIGLGEDNANYTQEEFIVPSNESIKVSSVVSSLTPVESIFGTRSWQEQARIYVDNNLVQSWLGPPRKMGETKNFFNYDSWVFETLKPSSGNIVGKITFTITDDDLN